MKFNNEFESLLDKANDDLDISQRSIQGKKKILWIACFHSQQAAEKALKAFLSFKKAEYPKIHDLMEIVTLCEKFDTEFTFIKELCHHLNPYSVRVRYTDELNLNLDDAKKAIKAAEGIIEFVLGKINRKYRRT